MRFKTETGSVYEVDTKNNRARRESGVGKITNRFKDDGLWKNYASITEIAVGLRVIFHWDMVDTPPLDPDMGGGIPITYTSPIVEILPDLN